MWESEGSTNFIRQVLIGGQPHFNYVMEDGQLMEALQLGKELGPTADTPDKDRGNYNTTVGLSGGHNVHQDTLAPRSRTGSQEKKHLFVAASKVQEKLGNDCAKPGFYTATKEGRARYAQGLQALFPDGVPERLPTGDLPPNKFLSNTEGVTTSGSQFMVANIVSEGNEGPHVFLVTLEEGPGNVHRILSIVPLDKADWVGEGNQGLAVGYDEQKHSVLPGSPAGKGRPLAGMAEAGHLLVGPCKALSGQGSGGCYSHCDDNENRSCSISTNFAIPDGLRLIIERHAQIMFNKKAALQQSSRHCIYEALREEMKEHAARIEPWRLVRDSQGLLEYRNHVGESGFLYTVNKESGRLVSCALLTKNGFNKQTCHGSSIRHGISHLHREDNVSLEAMAEVLACTLGWTSCYVMATTMMAVGTSPHQAGSLTQRFVATAKSLFISPCGGPCTRYGANKFFVTPSEVALLARTLVKERSRLQPLEGKMLRHQSFKEVLKAVMAHKGAGALTGTDLVHAAVIAGFLDQPSLAGEAVLEKQNSLGKKLKRLLGSAGTEANIQGFISNCAVVEDVTTAYAENWGCETYRAAGNPSDNNRKRKDTSDTAPQRARAATEPKLDVAFPGQSYVILIDGKLWELRPGQTDLVAMEPLVLEKEGSWHRKFSEVWSEGPIAEEAPISIRKDKALCEHSTFRWTPAVSGHLRDLFQKPVPKGGMDRRLEELHQALVQEMGVLHLHKPEDRYFVRWKPTTKDQSYQVIGRKHNKGKQKQSVGTTSRTKKAPPPSSSYSPHSSCDWKPLPHLCSNSSARSQSGAL